MAIIWWEDFEALSTANLGWRLDSVGTSVAIVSGINGMTGQCLRLPASQQGGDVGFLLPSTYAEGLFSTAMLIPSGSFTATNILQFNLGAISNISIRLNSTGSITALSGSTELGTSSVGVIPGNKRFRIEVGFKIDGSAGEVVVKIDTGNGQTTILNLTSKNTNNGAATINRVQVDIGTLSHFLYYDDMWFDTDKTAFRNDLTFKRLAPSADVSGVSTPSTGSDRYAVIDESPASTADYLTFGTTGEDLYECTDLSATPASIAGVGVYYVASKTDAGTLEFRGRLKSNTDYANGATNGLNMSTLGYSDFFATDPQGGGTWTKARVDAVRLATERIS